MGDDSEDCHTLEIRYVALIFIELSNSRHIRGNRVVRIASKTEIVSYTAVAAGFLARQSVNKILQCLVISSYFGPLLHPGGFVQNVLFVLVPSHEEILFAFLQVGAQTSALFLELYVVVCF